MCVHAHMPCCHRPSRRLPPTAARPSGWPAGQVTTEPRVAWVAEQLAAVSLADPPAIPPEFKAGQVGGWVGGREGGQHTTHPPADEAVLHIVVDPGVFGWGLQGRGQRPFCLPGHWPKGRALARGRPCCSASVAACRPVDPSLSHGLRRVLCWPCCVLLCCAAQACLAQYSLDGQWYRAHVERVNRSEPLYEVFFIDFGNRERVAGNKASERGGEAAARVPRGPGGVGVAGRSAARAYTRKRRVR